MGLALGPPRVDNASVNQAKANPIPLPCAVLALSVAVCIGSAGAADAAALRASHAGQAEHRETLEQLIYVLQQAAQDLTDRLDNRALALERQAIRPTLALTPHRPAAAQQAVAPVPHLRDALLNLPPPAR